MIIYMEFGYDLHENSEPQHTGYMQCKLINNKKLDYYIHRYDPTRLLNILRDTFGESVLYKFDENQRKIVAISFLCLFILQNAMTQHYINIYMQFTEL